MTYREIIRALLRGEAEQYVPEGLSFSYPVPSRDAEGKVVDNFFIFAVDHATGIPTTPYARLGIHADTGKLAYYHPEEEYPFTPTEPQHPVTLPYRDYRKLAEYYEELYPQIRSLTLSDTLSPKDHQLLQDYYLTQHRLFGSQMGFYRQTAPHFYRDMNKQVSGTITFVGMLYAGKARHSDFRHFLEMYETDEEKHRAAGISPEEYAHVQRSGSVTLRQVQFANKHNFDLNKLEKKADYAIAARAYGPSSFRKDNPHGERMEEVRNIARRLREEYDLTLPVDLDTLAARLGIRVEYRDMESPKDGCVLLESVQPVITINSRAYPLRQRFTLAHEIGHVMIPWHTGTPQCDTGNPTVTIGGRTLIDSQEQEANTFAAELLMPSDWLREQKAAATREEETNKLEELLNLIQETAGVSFLAALYALEYILKPGEVICIVFNRPGDDRDEDEKPCKFLRGENVTNWRSLKTARPKLKKEFLELDNFHKGIYHILHFKRSDC